MKLIRQAMIYSLYFAPRGRDRLLAMGEQLGLGHLSYEDRLIGIVGDSGSGKSLIIRGMFPGLELVNDDKAFNPSRLMQIRDALDNDFNCSTYHLDMRFQLAFTQMHEIADFVNTAVRRDRRVIVEHFDLLYPYLDCNADILIGIGEEIIVTRPSIFGPLPKDIYSIVFDSLKYRRMAHTAEDITALVLKKDYLVPYKFWNSDVRGGFVLHFAEKPDIDLEELEQKVQSIIDAKIPVSYLDDNHILVGEEKLSCTGSRIHINNTSEIENFHLIKEFRFDYQNDMYALAGMVGFREWDPVDLNRVTREAR